MTMEQDGKDRARLLRHLAGAGSYGIVSPLGCGRISLYREVKGTSLGAGYVSAELVAHLVGEGLIVWSGKGQGARLALAPATGPAATAPERTPLAAAPPVPSMDERESPLLWLHRRPGKDGRPQISDAEFAAGERFRADITLAQMLPRTTMNWDAALTPEERGTGPRDFAGASDAALAARQRVRLACERLGPELSGLAIDVCGFLKKLDLVERERRWPARSAKVVLRVALGALVAHYGLERPARPSGVRAWRGEGARPAQFPARSA
ncbi:DUF6456 domain-containing protein [Bosea sp. BH3]|uniref:DUF6456 domain-containing protein n=1 Tax=Bosea sp. BH3 TaxID=2871701 RepID=UPI0021CAF7A7|nr:DUF6456 domain-containing protein [Bosea sp. BH3]MCU4178978.1 DUF6456 domain-containing protein [Bosea sp. BH3]